MGADITDQMYIHNRRDCATKQRSTVAAKSFRSPSRRAVELNDDVLYRIFDHVDSPDAGRAAVVCTQWRRTATPAAYKHVILHAGSWKYARALARTLEQYSHLRQYVKEVTIIHCARHVARYGAGFHTSLYSWLVRIPENTLERCRAIGTAAIDCLLGFSAIRTARRLSLLLIAYSTVATSIGPHPENPLLSSRSLSHMEITHTHVNLAHCAPRSIHRKVFARSSTRFLQRLIPDFTVIWANTLHTDLTLTISVPPHEGGVSFSELEEILYCAGTNLAQCRILVVVLSFEPVIARLDTMMYTRDIVMNDTCSCKREPACPVDVRGVPESAAAVCALLISKRGFEVHTPLAVWRAMLGRRVGGRAAWVGLEMSAMPEEEISTLAGPGCSECNTVAQTVFALTRADLDQLNAARGAS